MQDIHIVFLVGMVTSSLFVFWVISLIEKRFFAKRKKNKVLSSRHFHAFRQHLKRESYLRAVQMIKGIQNGLEMEARRRSRPQRSGRPETAAAPAAALQAQDVAACVALVEELFSEATAKEFDYFVTMLAGVRQSRNLGDSTRFATAALQCLRTELHADAAEDVASQAHSPVAPAAERPRAEARNARLVQAPTIGLAPQGRPARSPDHARAGSFRPVGGAAPIDASAA